ncbi:hypothetical protein LXL04_012191 [Taraxacum kok-saghyz]
MDKIFGDPDRRRYSPYSGCRWVFVVVDVGRDGDGGVGGGGVDSLNLNGRRHILLISVIRFYNESPSSTMGYCLIKNLAKENSVGKNFSEGKKSAVYS